MHIVIICYPVCDVMNFEINLSFLIKPFSYMTKKSWQNCKCFKKKRVKNVFFIIFKGLSVVINCCRPESEPLNCCRPESEPLNSHNTQQYFLLQTLPWNMKLHAKRNILRFLEIPVLETITRFKLACKRSLQLAYSKHLKHVQLDFHRKNAKK